MASTGSSLSGSSSIQSAGGEAAKSKTSSAGRKQRPSGQTQQSASAAATPSSTEFTVIDHHNTTTTAVGTRASSSQAGSSNTQTRQTFHSHSSSHEGGGRSSSSSAARPAGTGIIRSPTAWLQRKIHLRPQSRGVHLVTDELLKQLPELNDFVVGLIHIQVMHTSASLALNENWDPDVREDMEMFLSRLVPESIPFRHSCEGPDDMPAHIKACFMGSSLTIPITEGRLSLGQWQGIWLCEHRNRAGSRKVVVTINGATRDTAS